ncbi:helix-turn-helix domain-containing protein [Methylobacterium phyllostachyos]|nr:helix-turn-helix domain-containing protein [Methylobacterium phyllostachyos]
MITDPTRRRAPGSRPRSRRSTEGALCESLQPLAYRPKDAAAMLGVSRSTIHQMIADGEIVARTLGSATLIPYSELARVLDGAALSAATKAA